MNQEDILLQIENWKNGNLDVLLSLSQELIDQSRDEKDSDLYVRGNYFASYACLRKGKLDKTMHHSLEALKFVNRQNEPELFAKINNTMGVLNYLDKNEMMALDYYLEGLEIAKIHKLEACISTFLVNIGSLYQSLNQHEKAISYFIESENIPENLMKEEEYQHKQIHVYLNLAISYLHLERFHYAEKYIEMVFQNELNYKGGSLQFISRCVWCRVKLRLGEKALVSEHLLNLVKSFSNPVEEIEYVKDMEEFYFLLKEMGQYEYLDQVLTQFESYIKTQNSKSLMIQALEMRLDYCLACGEKEKYKELCMKYFELNQQLKSEQNEKGIKALETKFILQKREQMVVENEKTKEQLQKKSEEDPLTHMANRYRLEKYFISIIDDLRMKESLLTVGIIDVDYFKQYNDCYGHVKGDECLRRIADVISSFVDNIHGVCARYGGDEFVVVLPKLNRTEVEDLAEGIMKSIRMLKIDHKKSNISPVVTVSQGYYVSRTVIETSLENYIENADKSLYFVKNEERDSFCISQHKEI